MLRIAYDLYYGKGWIKKTKKHVTCSSKKKNARDRVLTAIEITVQHSPPRRTRLHESHASVKSCYRDILFAKDMPYPHVMNVV